MLKYIKLIVLVFILTGCVNTTVNPIDPEMDSPILIGNTTNAPWGCMLWIERATEKQKCCVLEPIVPSEEEPDVEGWKLESWDC